MHYWELPTWQNLSISMMTDSYKILSNQDFSKNNLAILGNHGNVIIGVATRELWGMPNEDKTFGATPEEMAVLDSTETDKYIREVEHHAALGKRFSGESSAAATADAELDPATIMLLIELGMKLIKFIRERRKPK